MKRRKLHITLRIGVLAIVMGVINSLAINAEQASDRAIVVRHEDAKFVPVDSARPGGTRIAVLRGDPSTGPSSMLMKMQKSPGALHYHSSDYELVVVEGRMRHWIEGQVGKETPVMGPGSYWYQPRMQPHGDECLSDVCVMFITWSGKRDAVPVTRR